MSVAWTPNGGDVRLLDRRQHGRVDFGRHRLHSHVRLCPQLSTHAALLLQRGWALQLPVRRADRPLPVLSRPLDRPSAPAGRRNHVGLAASICRQPSQLLPPKRSPHLPSHAWSHLPLPSLPCAFRRLLVRRPAL